VLTREKGNKPKTDKIYMELEGAGGKAELGVGGSRGKG
jgi:hypothetical protein